MAREDTIQPPPPPPTASIEAPQMVSSEVILNGKSVVKLTKEEAGNEVEVPPVTVQQILARIRERKAKSTLLMAIPDEHLARFYGIKDAKTLWAAIKTRSADCLDKGYDRFERLLSLLEIHGAGVSTEDTNQKFLRSLPSARSNISLIMRNKPVIDNLDIDDLYNNLKVYEGDIKGSSRSSSLNVAFVSAESTGSNN
nr:ribonuclease H-like domain-containing protein [Tanacetum cinerariifolium]